MPEGPSLRPQFKSRRDKIAWYLDEIDCYKDDMGRWYTLFIRRILPFLIFIVPLNIVCTKIYQSVTARYLSMILDPASGAGKIVFWLVTMLIFLAMLIFLPRVATFFEFAVSGVFYYLAFTATYIVERNGQLIEKGLITNGFGYFVIITLSIFMFMKLVFFVLEVMYRIVFRGEHEPRAYKDGYDDIVL